MKRDTLPAYLKNASNAYARGGEGPMIEAFLRDTARASLETRCSDLDRLVEEIYENHRNARLDYGAIVRKTIIEPIFKKLDGHENDDVFFRRLFGVYFKFGLSLEEQRGEPSELIDSCIKAFKKSSATCRAKCFAALVEMYETTDDKYRETWLLQRLLPALGLPDGDGKLAQFREALPSLDQTKELAGWRNVAGISAKHAGIEAPQF